MPAQFTTADGRGEEIYLYCPRARPAFPRPHSPRRFRPPLGAAVVDAAESSAGRQAVTASALTGFAAGRHDDLQQRCRRAEPACAAKSRRPAQSAFSRKLAGELASSPASPPLPGRYSRCFTAFKILTHVRGRAKSSIRPSKPTGRRARPGRQIGRFSPQVLIGLHCSGPAFAAARPADALAAAASRR